MGGATRGQRDISRSEIELFAKHMVGVSVARAAPHLFAQVPKVSLLGHRLRLSLEFGIAYVHYVYSSCYSALLIPSLRYLRGGHYLSKLYVFGLPCRDRATIACSFVPTTISR
eukprot:6179103-Pleurochrysis_carterae.AAC.1